MKNEEMKSYWSQEVSKLLDISTSTLRKWSIALEGEGYAFIRDENDKRAYLERDLMPLQKMKELLAEGMGMENAAKAVVLRFAEQMSDSVTMVVRDQDERSSERYLEVLTQLQEVNNQNREMREYMERMERRMERQHEGITEILREQLEVRKMLAAAQEKRWWKFWK